MTKIVTIDKTALARVGGGNGHGAFAGLHPAFANDMLLYMGSKNYNPPRR